MDRETEKKQIIKMYQIRRELKYNNRVSMKSKHLSLIISRLPKVWVLGESVTHLDIYIYKCQNKKPKPAEKTRKMKTSEKKIKSKRNKNDETENVWYKR